MTLKSRLNAVFFLVIFAILSIMFFSFLAIYSYGQAKQHLNINVHALIIISALIALICVIIFKRLTSRTFESIESFNNEKISALEGVITKQQKAIHELEVLNELVGFVTSEYKPDVILKNLVDKTKELIKSGYCAAVTFEPGSFVTRVFVSCEDIQNPSLVQLSPDGFFKETLKNLTPSRFSVQQQNVTEDPRGYVKIPELNLEVKDILAVPLISFGKLSGMLLLANKLDGSFNQEDEDILVRFTSWAFQIIAMHEKITGLAITDSLTGLSNHRYFQERMNDEFEIAKRYRRDLSLLILNIDNFKTFNNTYGHQVGDAILKSIGSIIKSQIRNTDFPARYGGEEFAVIMPGTNYDGARILAERIRKKIAGTPFSLPDNERAIVTVSIGFASITENTKDKTELIEITDRALCFAKEHGRNLSYGFSDG